MFTVVYFGSHKDLHFREFTATPCTCGGTHRGETRYELHDAAGTRVLQCVRSTSLQDVPKRATTDRIRRARQGST